jgi:hypothetical protein
MKNGGVIPISTSQTSSWRAQMNLTFRTMVMLAVLAWGVGLSPRAFAQDQKPPQTLDLTKLSIQIVNATVVTKLEGVNGNKFEETRTRNRTPATSTSSSLSP